MILFNIFSLNNNLVRTCIWWKQQARTEPCLFSNSWEINLMIDRSLWIKGNHSNFCILFFHRGHSGIVQVQKVCCCLWIWIISLLPSDPSEQSTLSPGVPRVMWLRELHHPVMLFPSGLHSSVYYCTVAVVQCLSNTSCNSTSTRRSVLVVATVDREVAVIVTIWSATNSALVVVATSRENNNSIHL